jgi:hypothetical protein
MGGRAGRERELFFLPAFIFNTMGEISQLIDAASQRPAANLDLFLSYCDP